MIVTNDIVENVYSGPLFYVDLSAVIVGIIDYTPHVFIMLTDDNDMYPYKALPYGKFDSQKHQKMQQGLRMLVQEKTGITIQYVEQLYSFGDNGRIRHVDKNKNASISVGYLALTQKQQQYDNWFNWYQFFPWEDWRCGVPDIIKKTIHPLLKNCVKESQQNSAIGMADNWCSRMYQFFALGKTSWDPERVLERYEILYEAGLVYESIHDGHEIACQRYQEMGCKYPKLGQELNFDHRRILATAMSRLRAKIKYRPVVFDVMPEKFTLFTLQKNVEGIYGMLFHKQNFRRHVMKSALIEATHDICIETGGRPAQLYRFADHLSIERSQLSLLPPTRR